MSGSRLYLGVVLLGMLLASCAPYPPSDPYSQRAWADGAIEATQQAQLAREAETTRQAAVRAALASEEIAAALAPVQAQQTAMALEITAGVATDSAARATSTEQAVRTTATQQAAAATATQAFSYWQATATVGAAVRAEESARIYGTFKYISAAIGMIGGIAILVVLLWKGGDLLLTLLERLLMVKVTKFGVMIYTPDPDGEMSWKPAAAIMEQTYYRPRREMGAPAMPDRAHAFEQITPSVTRSPIGPRDEMRDLALALVEDSIESFGSGANTIASLERLKAVPRPRRKWSNDLRQFVVHALESAGAIDAKNGSGTYLTRRYQNLEELWGELEGGHLRLKQAPRPAAPRPYSPAVH